MDSNDHYLTLGILKKASQKEIKSAYRRLARKYHPDRNSTVSDDIMKNINIAFEVLSDPEKKNEYDKTNFNFVENKDITNKNSENQKNIDNNSSINNDYTEWQENKSSSAYSATTLHDYSDFINDNNTTLKPEETSSTLHQLEIPQSQYQIIVEPSLCLAFGSCETLAPKVFVVEKNRRINPKAIVKSETGADFETILDAAKTCPTKAIIIIDRHSGERIYP